MAIINPHFTNIARFVVLFASLLGLMLSSCRKNSEVTSAADYYDIAISTASTRFGSYYEVNAFNYVDSSYRHAKHLSVSERFKFYGFYCGYYYQARKDYSKAMAYADSMVMVIEKGNNRGLMVKQHAQAYYSKGDVYFAAGDYEDAYKYYFKTKIIAQKLDDCSSSEYSYRLGMVLYKQKRFRSAAENFKIAFAESSNCKSEFVVFLRRQELLNNTALSFGKAGIRDSALAYYEAALSFIDQQEPKYPDGTTTFRMARGVIYGNMGDIYVQKGEPAMAEKLFLRSIELNSAPHTELADGQLTRIKLAKLYKQQNQRTAFHQILTNVSGGMDSIDNAEVKMNWYGLMSDYFISENKPLQAFQSLSTYNILRDSIQKGNEGLIGGDANAQLLRLEKEYEIDILKKNSQLQQVYLIVAVIFTGLILIIVFLVYRNGERSKKSVKELRKLNDQINLQNETLEEALGSLEESSKAKDRILHAVAHDLRNPVGGIAALSGLMLDNNDGSKEHEEVFSLIQNTSNDTLTLINELLEAAEGNQVETTNRQWVDVNSLLRNNADLLQFKAKEKDQQIFTDLPNVPTQIFANREKMGRVISNLISNAVKFSPNGTKITVRTYPAGEKVIISVSDEGIGIPEHIQQNIFDMFTTAKRAGTAGEKPFGLGLFISSEIVKAHEGRLWFENNAGEGVTFFIELDGEENKTE